MASEAKKAKRIGVRFWEFLRKTFLSRAYRLKQDEIRLERKYDEALKKARATGKREDVYEVKSQYEPDLQYYYEYQEVLYTEQLLKQANSLRVHIPSKPRFGDEGREESEDWEFGGAIGI